MGEIMSMHMWSERRKEIISDTRKMVNQIADMYQTAYSYHILHQLRSELSGTNEQPMLLSQRKWQSYSRPLHAGPLYIMGGSEHQKWRRRYCVLQPDYTLEVYDSEEDFDAGNKPRFARKHSSFQVVDNVDAHISQQIKDYMRDFGYITNNVSNVMKKLGAATDASKRPTQHVLALAHPYRGKFFMAADTAVEKEKWLNSMLDASRQLEGIHCGNESQRKAFAFAIRQACDAQEHCGIKVNTSGTQEEIVSDFITDYLSNGCKAMLQTKVKGNPMKKYKMWESISRHLSMTVESIVEVDYPPARRKAETEAEELKPKMMASMPQISSAYDAASFEIVAALDAVYKYELEDRVLSKLPDMIMKMADAMSVCLHEVRDVFVSLASSVNRQVSASSSTFANNIDRYFVSQLDFAPRNPEIMQGVFQSALGNKSPLKALDDAFPKLDYSQHERELCLLLQKLLDAAICTFEILCGEAVHKNDGQLHVTTITKIQGRVLKKLGYDNMLVIKHFLSDVVLAVTYKILKHTIDAESKGKMTEFEDFIPAEYADFMPFVNVYRDTITKQLGEETRSGLAAGLKRLSNDHFNMDRYQSCSTIDSRSSACSTTSDDIPTSSKHEPSTSANSFEPSPLQKVAPTSSSVGDEGVPRMESQRTEEGTKENRGEAIASTSNDEADTEQKTYASGDCVTGEVAPLDGETGESFLMDENGERVMVRKVYGYSLTRESQVKDAGDFDKVPAEAPPSVATTEGWSAAGCPSVENQIDDALPSQNRAECDTKSNQDRPEAHISPDPHHQSNKLEDQEGQCSLPVTLVGCGLGKGVDGKWHTLANADMGETPGLDKPAPQVMGDFIDDASGEMGKSKANDVNRDGVTSYVNGVTANGEMQTNNSPSRDGDPCKERHDADIHTGDSNGAVRPDPANDEIIDNRLPTPAPRKHKSPKSPPNHRASNNPVHVETTSGHPAHPDIEKYNGVLEQIIHTGEEKLI